ncbi:MAG: hypothetical protein CL583_13385 [Alteromonadaceae bacterium]|nr:hypothetical protein [Alteromonadaceae bacterium]|tara:strand:- start:1154 stop:2068 length:915 start_codon:yes stop_codon:yes gene_type:complete
MSQARYSIIPTAVLEDDRVTAQQLRILATLGSFMGKDNEGFPSQSKIAERAKCSRQTVNKALRCLADFGYIQVIGRTRGGLKRALRYRVILDVNLSDIEAESPMFPDVKKGDIDVKEVDNDVNPEGDNDVNPMELTAKEDTQEKKPTPKRVSPKKVSEEILSLLPKAKARMAPRDSLPKVVKTILNQTDEQTLLSAVKACYSDPKHTAEDGQYAPSIYSWLKNGVWKNWVGEAKQNSTLTEEDWAAAFRIYVEGGGWPITAFSPAPHEPGCTAPAKMLRHAAKLLAGSPAEKGILKNLEIGEAA